MSEIIVGNGGSCSHVLKRHVGDAPRNFYPSAADNDGLLATVHGIMSRAKDDGNIVHIRADDGTFYDFEVPMPVIAK